MALHINEHGGGFCQNKNKDIPSYMMLQMIFNVVFVLSPQTLSDVFLVNT